MSLNLRAEGCANGDALDNQQADASGKEQVLNALGDMAGKFRSRVGESLAAIREHNVPLEEGTTSSLEALKAYTAATAGTGEARVSAPARHGTGSGIRGGMELAGNPLQQSGRDGPFPRERHPRLPGKGPRQRAGKVQYRILLPSERYGESRKSVGLHLAVARDLSPRFQGILLVGRLRGKRDGTIRGSAEADGTVLEMDPDLPGTATTISYIPFSSGPF